jgi:hypothetical protein
MYRPWLRYLFQFDFSRTGGENASKIKDAVFEVRPVGRTLRVAVGQFKAPFGLQQLTSSGRQQYVDRAITDNKFSPGREMGATFTGSVADSKVWYAVGAFNGSGESVTQSTRSPFFVARLFVNPIGAYTLAEGSTDAGDRRQLHFGVAVRTGNQIRGRTLEGIVEDADRQTAVGAEIAVKWPRFFSTVEHFWMNDERDNPVVAPAINSRGYHAQASYMLIPPNLEVGVRYAAIDGDTSLNESGVSELRAVVGHYWQGHGLKLLADIGRIGFDAGFADLSSRARQGLPSLGPRLVDGASLADIQFRLEVLVSF